MRQRRRASRVRTGAWHGSSKAPSVGRHAAGLRPTAACRLAGLLVGRSHAVAVGPPLPGVMPILHCPKAPQPCSLVLLLGPTPPPPTHTITTTITTSPCGSTQTSLSCRTAGDRGKGAGGQPVCLLHEADDRQRVRHHRPAALAGQQRRGAEHRWVVCACTPSNKARGCDRQRAALGGTPHVARQHIVAQRACGRDVQADHGAALSWPLCLPVWPAGGCSAALPRPCSARQPVASPCSKPGNRRHLRCLRAPASAAHTHPCPASCALPSPPAAKGSFLQQFLAATQGLGPAERGAYLEHPPAGAPDIDSIHEVRRCREAGGRGGMPRPVKFACLLESAVVAGQAGRGVAPDDGTMTGHA